MMPFNETPETWMQMEMRDLGRDQEIYIQLMRECGLEPSMEDLETIREQTREKLILASMRALDLNRTLFEHYAGSKAIVWRRNGHLEVECRLLPDGEWKLIPRNQL